MLCPKCGKESNNLRVCAFCQAPYPTDVASNAGAAVGAGARWSRRAQWSAVAILAMSAVGYYVVMRVPPIPSGVVMPNVIAAPMSLNEATAILTTVNATASVAMLRGELTVRIPATTFPEQRAGQLALAQQYARADEIVQGTKRAINFVDPDGRRFARADPATGVSLTQ